MREKDVKQTWFSLFLEGFRPPLVTLWRNRPCRALSEGGMREKDVKKTCFLCFLSAVAESALSGALGGWSA